MAPILKPEIFTIPRIATVNVHFGIAPHYRGEHTIFWPLYFGDYENIGVTLHQINKGIDSGGILAQGFPALEMYDTEATLWAKSSRIAVNMVSDLLDAAQKGKIQGRKQDSQGRLFLRRDRKIWRDLHYYLKRNVLRKYPTSHPQRINKYF
jgi:methionyl-tRNA formyltransferase